MPEQATHKSNNPWLFIAGIAVVFVLIGLSYLVFPAPPPQASQDKAGDEPEVVFVLENEPAAATESNTADKANKTGK